MGLSDSYYRRTRINIPLPAFTQNLTISLMLKTIHHHLAMLTTTVIAVRVDALWQQSRTMYGDFKDVKTNH